MADDRDDDVRNEDVADQDVTDQDVADQDVADQDVADQDVADQAAADQDVADQDAEDRGVAADAGAASSDRAEASRRGAEVRRRLGTAFGWLAGGATGMLVNYGLLLAIGEGYPTTYTTFGLFLLGAFSGMALADRLGPRGFRPLGIAAGVLLAVVVALVAAFMLSPER